VVRTYIAGIQNIMLRKILRPKKDELFQEWRKLPTNTVIFHYYCLAAFSTDLVD
jgi:hypothetical protein